MGVKTTPTTRQLYHIACSLVNSFTRQLNYILTNKGNEKKTE